MESTTNWLSNLKIRFGYGVTGSTAGIDPYSSAASLDATAAVSYTHLYSIAYIHFDVEDHTRQRRFYS